MKNYYPQKMNKQNLDQPLSLDITENELLDSKANEVDPRRYRDSFQIINDDLTDYSSTGSNKKETNANDQSRQNAYVDFEMFYDGLKKARIAGLIDNVNFKELSERSSDIKNESNKNNM